MFLSRRARDKRLLPPAAPGDADTRSYGPAATSQVLNLLPVPAAVIELRGDRFVFESVNRPFRLAGLGTTADQSALIEKLGQQIAAFIESAHILQVSR